MLKLWLPPKVWFHGSQSRSTGGEARRNGQTCASICWFAQSMRWVLITPFGKPVEPEVKRTFATVSGPTAPDAAATAPVGHVATRSVNGVARTPAGGLPP